MTHLLPNTILFDSKIQLIAVESYSQVLSNRLINDSKNAYLNIVYMEKHQKMNYRISFSEMNKLAQAINSKKPQISLGDMRRQVSQLKSSSVSKTKKQQC